MSRVLVSVVIATYNRARLLPRAIESALAQTFSEREVIVVDHASSDETPKVIGSFGDAVRGVRIGSLGRGGAGAPRNAGIEAGAGEYVAFLDDDDEWEKVKLERQVEVMETWPELLVISSDAEVIDADGWKTGERYLGHTSGVSGDAFERLLDENPVILSSALVRRSALVGAGGFSVRHPIYMVEDYHLWLRLAARGPFAHLDEPLVRYRRHGDSFGRTSHQRALRQQRAVLAAALLDPAVRRRALSVLRAIGRSYRRSASITLGR